MEKQLIDLLESKEFHALTSEELELVLSLISEEEYISRRAFIQRAQSEFTTEAKSLKVTPLSQSAALAHLKTKNSERKKQHFPLIFTYKIPAWTVAAAFIIMCLILSGLLLRTEEVSKQVNPQIAKVDTVYIEKYIKDTIYIDRVTKSETKNTYSISQQADSEQGKIIPGNSVQISKTELAMLQHLEGRLEPLDFNTSNQGKSLNDDRIGQLVLGRK